MTGLTEMLSRVRAALAQSPPAALDDVDAQADAARAGMRKFLPPTGDTFEQKLELFRARSAELKTDFQLLADPAKVAARLKAVASAEGWRRIATYAGELTDPACASLGLEVLRTDGPYDKAALEKCDAAVTQCDALVAQTGSVLVTSRSTGGRALTVLPPHHVVLARREQLLGGLADAFAMLKAACADNWPSMISFITGPSRTGDIERILVLGAHGPKKLTVLCV